ncbi:MAG: chemotaxis protein CheX [Planctomycetota bacterium]
MISFTGEYQGSLVLTFPTEVAERVVALFIGAEVTADDDDFADAVGELANMVSGNAKAGFEGKTVSISCPSVIIGTGHAVRQPSDMPIVIIPCDCECGSFAIEVSLRAAPALAAKSA